MQRRNVTIAALEGHEARAGALAAQLNQAWSGDDPLSVRLTTAGELQSDRLADIDVIILISHADVTQSTMLALLNLIDDAGVPVLAMLDAAPGPGNCFEYAGAMVITWDAPVAQLASVLRGLLHRQKEIKRLRAEVALSQRFHGGLKGEIAKMHEELQLAAMVQREFLPREAPCVHGINFAALWRPTNYVSGDIYDLLRLDEDHVGVFLADAVGHGVPAALMTMVICRSLVTKEIVGNTYHLVPPSEVLAHLNTEMIRRQGRSTRFATAAYAVINCRERTMTLAGGGHPPPVLLAADGSSRVLETPGGLLGVFSDERYDQIEVELGINDRVLFYTDGFEQAFPADETETDAYQRRIPTNRYRSEFEQLVRLPNAAEMVDVISSRIDDQAGSLHQIDDLTLICMHVGALAEGLQRSDADDQVDNTSPASGGGLRLAS